MLKDIQMRTAASGMLIILSPAFAAVASAQFGQWEIVHRAPQTRQDFVMAYDSDRRELLLTGGGPSPFIFATDQATWSGDVWELSPASGPINRRGAAMAYDTDQNRMVLFGGFDSSGNGIDETWVWDGSSWRELNSNGPDGRGEHQIIWDGALDAILLFGGRTSTTGGDLGDTWQLIDDQWVEIRGSGPSPRSEFGMAYNSDRDRAYLFGGRSLDGNPAVFDETWEFDAFEEQWTLLTPTTAPPALYSMAMGYEGGNELVLLYGGIDSGGQTRGQTWIFDGTDWETDGTGTNPQVELGLSGAQMTFDSREDEILMFGGIDGEGRIRRELWRWNERDGWSLAEEAGPNGRAFHQFVWDWKNRAGVLTGGLGEELGEGTYLWDGAQWSEAETGIQEQGGIRRQHAMEYHRGVGQMILQGGADVGGMRLSPTPLIYSGTNWSQLMGNTPLPSLVTHSMAYDTKREVVVVIGGRGPEGFFNQQWEWDGSDWTEFTGDRPIDINNAALAYDSFHGELVLFGGSASSNDTHLFDGASWRTIPGTPDGPSARTGAASVYDIRRRRVVMFGGLLQPSAIQTNEIWEWDGSQWTEITVSSAENPEPRDQHDITYNPATGDVILFSGRVAGPLGTPSETWIYRGPETGPFFDDTWSIQ